jgi:hypothetical protein
VDNSPQSLVWLGAKIQIEPTQLLVVTSDNQIITHRVDIQTRDPLETRCERLEEFLGREVVQSDISLSLELQGGYQSDDKPCNQRSAAQLTATKKCGLVGWNATRWTLPFVRLKGD